MNPHELLSATGIGVRTAPFPLLSGDSEMSAAKGSLPELSAHSNYWEKSKLSDAPRLRIGAYAIRQGFSRGSGMYETVSGGSHVRASLESRYFRLEACAQGLDPGSSRGGHGAGVVSGTVEIHHDCGTVV